MIYRISIILYRYKYRIEKIDQYPALVVIDRWITRCVIVIFFSEKFQISIAHNHIMIKMIEWLKWRKKEERNDVNVE